MGKEFCFSPKNVEETGFFLVFRQYFRKTIRNFAVLHPLSSNLQGSPVCDCKRCANNKNDYFSRKKSVFGAKKRRKKPVFRGFPTLPQENAS